MTMYRRDFIKTAVATTCSGLLLTGEGRTAEKRSTIIVVQGTEPNKMLSLGLSKCGGIDSIIKKGAKVTIKPNAAWASHPEQAGNTHPFLVQACITQCRQHGATKIVLPENPCSSAKKAFRLSGIEKVCLNTGATLYALDSPTHFQEMALPKGKVLKKVNIAKDIINTDCLINMPVAKSHGSAGITVSMKNWMGAVQDRRSWHKGSLHQCIADFNTAISPNLIIVDATRIMVTNGPQGPGTIERPNQIILGRDPVAVDAYAATLFKKKPFDIPHIKIAHEMGIGCGDLNRIDIQKVSV